MALIKTGNGVTSITGKMAGNIYKRDGSGQHCNSIPRQVRHDPNTTQKTRRAAFSRLWHYYWRVAINQEQRNLWYIEAATHPTTNKLGEKIFLTGFQYFLRINLNRLVAGQRVFAEPDEKD